MNLETYYEYSHPGKYHQLKIWVSDGLNGLVHKILTVNDYTIDINPNPKTLLYRVGETIRLNKYSDKTEQAYFFNSLIFSTRIRWIRVICVSILVHSKAYELLEKSFDFNDGLFGLE